MKPKTINLKDILQSKTMNASSKAPPHHKLGEWLSTELKEAEEDHQLFDCETTFYNYSRITLQRNLHGIQTSLDIKIGNIEGESFYFADVRLIGQYYRPMLPVSGALETDQDKAKLLSYVADFVLSVRSGEIEKNPRLAEIIGAEYKAPYPI